MSDATKPLDPALVAAFVAHLRKEHHGQHNTSGLPYLSWCPPCVLVAELADRGAKLIEAQREALDCARLSVILETERNAAEATLRRVEVLRDEMNNAAEKLCAGRSNQIDRHTGGIIGGYADKLDAILLRPSTTTASEEGQ